jgi:photoactive yellow protein
MTTADTIAMTISATPDTAAAAGGTLPDFAHVTLAQLDAADASLLDTLNFGVVGLERTGRTALYNAYESQMAGLSRESVLGRDFFLTIGVCMNNFLVAQRFEDDPALDVTLDYVLTFRMRPTPVKLRRFRYILIQR